MRQRRGAGGDRGRPSPPLPSLERSFPGPKRDRARARGRHASGPPPSSARQRLSAEPLTLAPVRELGESPSSSRGAALVRSSCLSSLPALTHWRVTAEVSATRLNPGSESTVTRRSFLDSLRFEATESPSRTHLAKSRRPTAGRRGPHRV